MEDLREAVAVPRLLQGSDDDIGCLFSHVVLLVQQPGPALACSNTAACTFGIVVQQILNKFRSWIRGLQQVAHNILSM